MKAHFKFKDLKMRTKIMGKVHCGKAYHRKTGVVPLIRYTLYFKMRIIASNGGILPNNTGVKSLKDMKNLNGHRPKSRVGKLMNEKTELRQLYLFNKNRCKEKRKEKKKKGKTRTEKTN